MEKKWGMGLYSGVKVEQKFSKFPNSIPELTFLGFLELSSMSPKCVGHCPKCTGTGILKGFGTNLHF